MISTLLGATTPSVSIKVLERFVTGKNFEAETLVRWGVGIMLVSSTPVVGVV
jgi:hypothetical protein